LSFFLSLFFLLDFFAMVVPPLELRCGDTG
jgi:hypothetical protein